MWPLFWMNLFSTLFGIGLRVPSSDGRDWFGQGLWLALTAVMCIGCRILKEDRAKCATAVAVQVAIWSVAPLFVQPSRAMSVASGFLICLFAVLAATSARRYDVAKEPVPLLFVMATPMLGLLVGAMIGLWRLLCWTLGLRITHKSRRSEA